MGSEGGGMEMMMGGMVDDAQPQSIRQQIEQRLTEPATFDFRNVTIENVAKELREATGSFVVTDPRGVALTKYDGTLACLTFSADNLPLQVALREQLRTAALRAEVREDSLVITADTAELARRGIDADRWVNFDQAAAAKIHSMLSTEVSLQIVDEPLESALAQLSKTIDLPIDLDVRALEEIRITPDEPVNSSMKKAQARTLLEAILRPLDLTTSIEGERLLVTSKEAAESQLKLRIYWHDGLGLPVGDFSSIMQSIESSIEQATWESLGGPSTITPLGFSQEQRPGLLVSTTLSVHSQIESLPKILRDSHLGPDTGTAFPNQPRDRRGSMGGAAAAVEVQVEGGMF